MWEDYEDDGDNKKENGKLPPLSPEDKGRPVKKSATHPFWQRERKGKFESRATEPPRPQTAPADCQSGKMQKSGSYGNLAAALKLPENTSDEKARAAAKPVVQKPEDKDPEFYQGFDF